MGARVPHVSGDPMGQMRDHAYRIEPLSQYPALVETIAAWHWNEWGHADPGSTIKSWADGLRARSGSAGVPSSYIAISEPDGIPIGSVCLVASDMDTHPELSPWLAGLFVSALHRGRGVGSALTRHAMSKAFETGIDSLYLYTSKATSLYERLGWHVLFREHYEREWQDVMVYHATQTLPAAERKR